MLLVLFTILLLCSTFESRSLPTNNYNEDNNSKGPSRKKRTLRVTGNAYKILQ